MTIVNKPKNETIYLYGKPWWYDNRTKRVQQPFVDPKLALPYFRDNYGNISRTLVCGSPLSIDAKLNGATANVRTKFVNSTSEQYVRAYNKAYAELWDNGGLIPQAELGVSLAEGHEAIRMIVDRAKRLRSAYSALKRGQFKNFLYFLGTRPKKRHENTRWTRPKDAASLWLEYWLGWAPTIGDIYNCLEVLTGSAFWEPITLRGRGSSPFVISFFTKDVYQTGGLRTDYEAKGRVCVELGTMITVTNPNYFLLNQLGLVNPAAVLWAVVPFSFIADWFMNVGKILNGMTDFVGVSQSNSYTTRYVKFTGRYCEGSGLNNADPIYWKQQIFDCRGTFMNRTVGPISGPSFKTRIPSGLAITQGATAISLLVSLFTKG